ncbi:hypothetical protein BDK51DRAFT_30031, partial [Blyttiomyces helicus]
MSRSGADSDAHLTTLRNTWQFAAVAQFLHLFGSAFGLPDFETETLEVLLLSSDTEPKLVDMHIRMLKILTGNRTIGPDNWQDILAYQLRKRAGEEEELVIAGVDYVELPLNNK